MPRPRRVRPLLVLTAGLASAALLAGCYRAALALLRGAYHLYQGIGPGVGNALMGVVFALVFLRVRRVMPLVIAHALLDAVGFVGYPLLARAGLLG